MRPTDRSDHDDSGRSTQTVMASLLRLLRRELTDTVAPEITAQYPTYVVSLMGMMLDFMADWAAGEPYATVEDARAALASRLQTQTPLPRTHLPDMDDATQTDDLLARLVNLAANGERESELGEIVRSVAVASSQLYDGQGQRHARALQAERDQLAAVDIDITPDTFDAYARTKPELAGDPARKVTKIPGGHSKDTFLITLESGSELVIRRDFPFGPVNTSAPNEYALLAELARRSMPVPRPLLAEHDPEALGQPFLMVEKLPGVDAHEAGMTDKALGRSVSLELARLLAELHKADPADLGFQNAFGKPGDAVRSYLDSWKRWWRQHQLHNSSLLEAGFAWLERHVPADFPRVVTIHGDARPGNMLCLDGKVTALLDWEFAHPGDPAEDVLYAIGYVEPFVSGAEFTQAYLAAGGAPFNEASAHYYDVFRSLRNVICTEVAWSGFVRGYYPAFKLAAQGIVYKRMLAQQLAATLQSVPW